jgi:hypothetical protein
LNIFIFTINQEFWTRELMDRIMGYDYSIFLIGEQHKNQSEILFPFTEACGGGSREIVFFVKQSVVTIVQKD